ncbi:hypothetical protein [Streptomyces sp. NRRL S-350]|uniref:hypothetical protein n=1 Tax=Streptomyces sp. NRRL S-350 TaxID=1463902 RepID=UPI0004C0FCF6|nr:hypothetical protein [Streptomyces sp. NRRL S-350]
MPTDHATTAPPYEPSAALTGALKAWHDSVEEEERLRHAARKAVADDLREYRIPVAEIAEHVPWTTATIHGITNEYGVGDLIRSNAPGHADRPKYKPSPALAAALKAWAQSVTDEEIARKTAREAVADDLKASMISNSEMAEHVPWTEETVRVIAKEYGVPGGRRRKTRTLRSKLAG